MHKFAIFLLVFFCSKPAIGQSVRLSLTISDVSNIAVQDATINLNQKKYQADSLGKAAIVLAPGHYIINVTSVNHFPYSLSLVTGNDTSIHIIMRLRESLLGVVIVTAASRNIARNEMSVQNITAAQLRKIPVVLGEIDPLKTITLLPGIKNGGEASAGIYVRGGGPDQNLVLMDGIPVYNPNHLLGFFSIFNGEAIRNTEVIKGGIPAQYGGRLSSVISIETREGNKDSIKASGGIGLISSRISLEGPLIKGKSSFIISARRTYIDQVARVVAKSRIGGNGYFFYDINAKADYIINTKNKLLLTFYSGQDRFSFQDPNEKQDGRNRVFKTYWGNSLIGLSWRQQAGKKTVQETTIVYNKFNLDSHYGYSTNSFLFASGLQDNQVKTDWTSTRNKWLTFKWGALYTWHRFTPGAGSYTTGVQEFKSKISGLYAHEAAAYVSADLYVTPELNIIAGLRASYFNQVGPTQRIIYNSDGAPTGEVEEFKAGKSIAKYFYPEPRFNILYKLSNTSSMKMSYTRTIQYLHLATTSAATFPSDLWIPSSRVVKPSIARQLAMGYFKNFAGNTWEASVETYYKVMNNQLEFKPGAQLLLNQNLEGEMIFGAGKAYGIEIFLQKKLGKLTGWIGYTLSRTERKFAALNQGKAFPYRYDRLHDLSIVASYPLSAKWEASAVFVYGTGNALTIPTGRFTYNLGFNPVSQEPLFTNINQYDKVNDYRMPPYHRLDISFTYTPKPFSTRRYKSSWNLSIYNVYNRSNPYFVYFEADESLQTIKGKEVYLFPIVPSVTWNFKFR
ncbi:MAG: TonB-dependent receptor plug domain-containing protein [Chitinophagaceae bacterium]